jgi:hypothetical protein
MLKFLKRTLSLVWKGWSAYRLYEFLRDHFDDIL